MRVIAVRIKKLSTKHLYSIVTEKSRDAGRVNDKIPFQNQQLPFLLMLKKWTLNDISQAKHK